jgi:glycerol-3-phosphate acyltransferase PlsX
VTLLDVGANAEARVEHLVQFAYMGAAFAIGVLGLARPRVGLLSNGGEAGRGSQLLIDAHALLSERAGAGAGGAGGGMLEFVGNVEGDGLVGGAADVVVTDGLTGNIALKLIEGVSQVMLGAVRDAAGSSRRATVGGMLLRPALRGFRAEIDPESQGGAYLLGLRRLGVVAHGRFGREGIAQAILRAARDVEMDVVGRTQAALAVAGALRRSAAAGASGDGATVPGHDE